MIPVRLEIKNFLPYRSPDPLRFDGMHIACLTGANGAGKSSLLDAITWALWGRARGRRDDELVHLGQDDMYVQLDFEQEAIRYRVLRRRNRGRRGQGTLDLFVFREDGTPNPIKAGGLRETQAQINDLLRLDYETFVHSAFLQQGKADAFTTRTAAERKKILSDILSLDRWTRYEDAVKEKQREITNNIHVFEMRIQEIDAELAQKPGLENERDDAASSHETAQTALVEAQERLKELEHAPGDLRAARDQRANHVHRQREYQTEIQELETVIQGHDARLAGYREVIDAREEIEAGYAALRSAREADQALSDQLRKLSSLKDERNALQSQIDAARTRLESEINSTQQRIGELEATVQKDYTADLEAVQAEVAELTVQEQHFEGLKETISTLREERAGAEALKKTLTAEGQALRDRQDRLEATDDNIATCPLCGQPLSPELRDKLLLEVQEEVTARREDYRLNNEKIQQLYDQLTTTRSEHDALEVTLRRLPPLREKVGVLQTQAQAVEEAATQLTQYRADLEKLQEQLVQEAFAQEIRAQLATLDAQQNGLGYDSDAHDTMREQLEAHTRYEELYTRLNIALESTETTQQARDAAAARHTRLNQACEEIEAQMLQVDADIARLTALVDEYNDREAEVRALHTRERSAYERLTAAQQALNALKQQAERKIKFEERRDAARQQEAIYDELKQAFGKNGVPAMMIESAIPELETAANGLLAQMTDGRMSLRFNTLREKVTGGITETLDIEIADELGTRSYEMYSGGEAFRINFAIRVALSQMLARRAGAHLRTLFIDEGFGTQDEDGRGKLVEAINAIQGHFDLVLVITHIDELRDSFPVHIAVDKSANGSQIVLR